MVKKLRYYARFIVVCLLLKKMKLVRDLVRELSKLIGNYFISLASWCFCNEKLQGAEIENMCLNMS